MLVDVIDLLRCPVCGSEVELDGRILGCSSGHRFDVAKQGYVNLLRKPAGANADTPAMVAARDAFLDGGHYSPIADLVAQAASGAATLLEVGAGTGYYLSRALGSGARGVATDISAAACRRAARRERIGAVVADTWAGLPVADAAVDAVLCVFAPRNLAEFARILAPGGRLVVVTPEADHLAELRSQLGLLEVEEGKLERLRASAEGLFEPVAAHKWREVLDLDADTALRLVEMGPNALHEHGRPDAGPTTAAVTCTTWLKR